ncbi:MAG: GNAT family N-acetyltransferase [Candidatus Thorarchaeota archaeon]
MKPPESTAKGNSYRIRTASESDAEQISALYKRVWDEFDVQFPRELKASRQPSADLMRQWMKQEAYMVAESKNEIVGVVGCRLMHGTCQLTHMAVDSFHRSKGIGTSLTQRAIEFAKENNSFKIWLDTAPFMKKAISVYEKLGFTKCGFMRKHFWGLDIEFYELLLR